MSINRIIIHALFICFLSLIFAKLDCDAPLSGLILLNALIVAAGIIYGMFIMKNTYKEQVKKALEDLKKKP